MCNSGISIIVMMRHNKQTITYLLQWYIKYHIGDTVINKQYLLIIVTSSIVMVKQ